MRTEDLRAEPLARALHPGEWWDSPNPLYAVDKDAHIAQARRLLAVVDAVDAAGQLMTAEDEIEKLPIIGHDRAVMDALVKALHNAARGHADYGPIQEDRRGAHFEVRLRHSQVARVTVELDRYDSTTPTAPKQAAAPGPDKVALAKRLLEAHDALLATSAQEPGYDRNGQPLDQQAWTTWNDTVYCPAYTAFRTAMDAFRAAVPHEGMGSGRHPLNFRHECEAIIAAAIRDAAPQPRC